MDGLCMQRLSTRRIPFLPRDLSEIVGGYATKEPDRWQRGATRDCASWQDAYRFKEAMFAHDGSEGGLVVSRLPPNGWRSHVKLASDWFVFDQDTEEFPNRGCHFLYIWHQSLMPKEWARLENAKAQYLQDAR